jgi:hypothetical protein
LWRRALSFFKEKKRSIQDSGNRHQLAGGQAKTQDDRREHRTRQAFAMVRNELVLGGGPRRNLTQPIKPFPTHWDC